MRNAKLGLALALCAVTRSAPAQTCDEAHRCVVEWTIPTSIITVGPRLVADGAGQVYWANGSEVALTSGRSAPIIIGGTLRAPCEGRERVEWFDAAGSRVVWASLGSLCTTGHYGGGGATTLVRGGPNEQVFTLAADATWVGYTVRLADGSGEVRAVASNGPIVVTSLSAPPTRVALFASRVYWVEGLAVRSAPLATDGTICTAGPIANVGVASHRVTGLLVGTAGVIVATDAGVEKITLARATPLVSEPVVAIAIDAGFVYWTSAHRGAVAKTPLSGGSTVVLASHVHPTGVAADSGSVFFIEQAADTTIMRITPK